MARLPTPGDDNGIWGSLLNIFLRVSHDPNGNLAQGVVSDNQVATSAAIAKSKLAPLAIVDADVSSISESKVANLTTDLTNRLPYLSGIVADGTTDNAAIFNALANDAGKKYLPFGKILCKAPIVIPKNATILGSIPNTSANASGSSVPNGLTFDPTTIMAGGLAASVAADGANWVFTVASGHGLLAGDTLIASRFTTSGFNVASEVASVTATTLTVTNATIPAASDSGFLNAHKATVAASGSQWTFTVPASHGLVAGNSFTASGFSNTEFNIACLIDSVDSTHLYVNNRLATHATGGSSGWVNTHLIRLGTMTNLAAGTMLRDMWIECRGIPGSIGVYSSTLQEDGGLRDVTIHGAMFRGLVADSSNPLVAGNNLITDSVTTTSLRCLNYDIDYVRTIGSQNADSTYNGVQILGGNTTIRGLSHITAVGGGTGANTPAAQYRLDNARSAFFNQLHAENATDGILIGATSACIADQFVGLSGNADCITLVRVATPADATVNAQLDIGSLQANGSTVTLKDDPNVVSLTGQIGHYMTDLNGLMKFNTATQSLVAGTLSGDLTINTTITNIVTLTLTIGRWLITGNITAVPGASTTAIEMECVAGTSTATLNGARSVSLPIISTLEPVSAAVTFSCTVTTAGTVVLKAQATGAAATAKQKTSVNTFSAATGMVAIKAP